MLGWAKWKDNQWHQNLFRVHGQCTHGKKTSLPLSQKKTFSGKKYERGKNQNRL